MGLKSEMINWTIEIDGTFLALEQHYGQNLAVIFTCVCYSSHENFLLFQSILKAITNVLLLEYFWKFSCVVWVIFCKSSRARIFTIYG